MLRIYEDWLSLGWAYAKIGYPSLLLFLFYGGEIFSYPFKMAASTSDKRMPITTHPYKYLVMMLPQTRLLSCWSLPLIKDYFPYGTW